MVALFQGGGGGGGDWKHLEQSWIEEFSISVLEWEVSQVGCKIYGTKELEARESRNSLVGLWLL